MNSDGIKRLVMAFAADMEKVMLEEENMAKQPQFELIPPDKLIWELGQRATDVQYAVCYRHARQETEDSIKRHCVHLANYAMMIYWHAEQRRLAERGGEGRE